MKDNFIDKTRRDLIKYFAAGTVIAPIAGAAPLAKLIEVPKVELVEATINTAPCDLTKVQSVTILLEMMDGSRRWVHAEQTWGKRGTLPVGGLDVYINFDSGRSPATTHGNLGMSGSLL